MDDGDVWWMCGGRFADDGDVWWMCGGRFVDDVDDDAAGVVQCGGRKTSPRTSTIVQFIFHFVPLRSADIF